MVVTVRSILELEEARLRLLAGSAGLDRDVRWVHVSEMLDPTPWMKGGEFLLTTGLRLTEPGVIDAYLDRLRTCGVAGIGFSTGDYLGMHDVVPSGLVSGAEVRGIPLLEVPIDTPWVLISEYVSRRLAEEQHMLTQRAFDAQRQLTRAALNTEGRKDVVQLLANLVEGWAVLATPMGRVIDAFPRGAAEHVAGLLGDLSRVKETGSVAALHTAEGASISVHPLGAAGTVRRILVLGKDSAFDAFDRIVTASAVALLSFEAEQRLRLSPQRAAAASVLGAAMLDPTAPDDKIRRAAAGLGLDRRRPLRVARVALQHGEETVAQLVHDVFSAREATNVTVPDPDRDGDATYTILVQENIAVEDELRRLPTMLGNGTRIGFSAPVLLGELALARRQASIALAQIHDSADRNAASFQELTSYQIIIGLARPEDVEDVVRTIMAPLEALDGGRHRLHEETLRAFLAQNGRWEEAARTLGIHRQTLVKRIGAIERRLGTSLQSADVRMALWFALQARSLGAG